MLAVPLHRHNLSVALLPTAAMLVYGWLSDGKGTTHLKCYDLRCFNPSLQFPRPRKYVEMDNGHNMREQLLPSGMKQFFSPLRMVQLLSVHSIFSLPMSSATKNITNLKTKVLLLGLIDQWTPILPCVRDIIQPVPSRYCMADSLVLGKLSILQSSLLCYLYDLAKY